MVVSWYAYPIADGAQTYLIVASTPVFQLNKYVPAGLLYTDALEAVVLAMQDEANKTANAIIEGIRNGRKE